VLVSDVMVTDLVTVGPDADLQKVVDQMNHAHIRHLYMRLAFQKDVSRRPLQFGSTVYNVALSHSAKEVKKEIKPYNRYWDDTRFIEAVCIAHPNEQAFLVLASHYGRYGYRRITAMLRVDGWGVNHKRVEHLWRQEGLKVPARQIVKRGRLWLNDGSCIRLRPEHRNHVWAYDFVFDRTCEGPAPETSECG
jgi:hypothetical protein